VVIKDSTAPVTCRHTTLCSRNCRAQELSEATAMQDSAAQNSY